MERNESALNEPCGDGEAKPVLMEIELALRGMQFGQVVVHVHDGVVVQLERVERRRLAMKRNPRG